jgi:hypothetical protein
VGVWVFVTVFCLIHMACCTCLFNVGICAPCMDYMNLLLSMLDYFVEIVIAFIRGIRRPLSTDIHLAAGSNGDG